MEIFILITIGLALYFLPSFVAFKRKHASTAGILVLNIFLGWTLLGWVFSLIWALSNPGSTQPQQVVIYNMAPGQTPGVPAPTSQDTRQSGSN